ncbi:MAG: hypothetical protein KAJ07_04600 [Planctomycetes bacterium]|nr:hypothetical protein [Planctomycetota bacterium]
MKTIFKPSSILFLLMFIFASFLFMAFDGPEDAFNATQWVLISSVAMPVLAQVVKVYRARGGHKISGQTIDYIVMGASLVMVFVWGSGLSYVQLEAPVFTDILPDNINIGLAYAGAVLGGLSSIFGRAYLWYTALKITIFDRVPWLKP